MKILHTAMVVDDLENTIRFYQEVLGMELVRKGESTDRKADLAFLRNKDSSHQIELISWREKSHGQKLGFDHISFEVPDIDNILAQAAKQKATMLREPILSRVFEARCAFITDPNGVKLELIERR